MKSSDPTLRRQLAGAALVAATLAGVSLFVPPAVVLRRVAEIADRPFVFGAVVVVLYLFRPLAAWPVTLLAAVVGYGYGVRLGIPVALAGAVGTCVPPFLFARYARGRTDLFDWLGESSGALFEATGSTRGIVVTRLIPIPSDVVSYAAGASGVPLRALVVGTAVGELPWTVVAVLAGSSMKGFAVGAVAIDWRLVAAAVLAALFLLVDPVYRRRTSN